MEGRPKNHKNVIFQEDSGADDAASQAELGIDNVGGVFVVLGSGCGIAFLISVIELLWNVKQVAVDEKVSLFIYSLFIGT